MIVIYYLLIFLSFTQAYEIFLVEKFSSNGYEYVYDFERMLYGLSIVFVFSLVLSLATKKASHIFLHIHFLLPVIPMIVLYSVGGGDSTYFAFSMLAFAFVLLIALTPVKLPSFHALSINGALWLMVLLAVFYALLMIQSGGLRYLNFDIWKIYEIRSEAAANLPGLFGYLSPIVGKFVVPVILVIALYKKRWIFVAFAFAMAVFIFATTAHKGPLFMPFAVTGIYFFLTFRKRLQLILIAHIGLAFLTLYSPSLGDTDQIFGGLTFRRVYLAPAKLNYDYYNFFSENEKVKWSTAKFTFGLVEKPYDMPIPLLIGEAQLGKPNVSANTGWLGAGYAHYGFSGLFIYAFIIGLLIKLSDVLARKTKPVFAVSLLIIPYLSLFTSSDLPTMFLTHGLLPILLLILVLKETGNSYGKNRSSELGSRSL
jgi:hypothetical protein